MLRVVIMRIAKSRSPGNRSGLRKFGVGYSPRIGIHKIRKRRSLSATSIGTEENSLGVPTAHNRALIYIRVEKHNQRNTLQVQRRHIMAE